MAVRVGKQTGEESISDPGIGFWTQSHQADKPREDPNVGARRDYGAFLEVLADFRYDQELGFAS